MTNEEWHSAMLKRLDVWLSMEQHASRPKLTQFMGMNNEEFIEWRETGIVPRTPRILWSIFPEELEYSEKWQGR